MASEMLGDTMTYAGSKLYPNNTTILRYLFLESEVIVEILLMLRGVNGFIYTKDQTSRLLTVNQRVIVSHLTPLILFQQLQNFAKFGNHITTISDFYSNHLHNRPPPSSSSPSSSPTSNPILQALSAALREYLSGFHSQVTSLNSRLSQLTLLELESVLAPSRRHMEILHQLLTKMQQRADKLDQGQDKSEGQSRQPAALDGVVLSTLYDSACEMSLLGDSQGMGIMLHLLVKTCRPYFDALGMWLEEGNLPVNSQEWFMVARNTALSDKSSLPAPVSWGEGYVLQHNKIPNFLQPVANEILVAGKSIVLLREIFAEFSQNYEKSLEQQKINIYVIGPAAVSLYNQFLNEVSEHFPQNIDAISAVNPKKSTPAKPVSTIQLDSEMELANPTAPFLGPISSYMGEEISPFLHYPDLDHGNLGNNSDVTSLFNPQPLPTLSNNLQGNLAKYVPLPENSFTLQPISVIIQKGVIEPILGRYNEDSQKLMRYLHEICLLHQNLINLRSFFLMEAGYAFHQFTISLFEKVDRGEVLGTYELNRILQDSLISAGQHESHLLSLDLPELLPSSRENANKPKEPSKSSAVLQFEPYTLPSLKAVYRVPSPLAVKRSKYAIESTIRIGLKTDHPNASLSIHLLRAKLLHFVNNLQHYLFNRVLQTGWDEFTLGVENAVDLDDLVQKHTTYVTKIFNQCLLNMKAAPVLSIIKRILNMSLRFSRNFLQYENYLEIASGKQNPSSSSSPSSQSPNDPQMLENFMQEFKNIDMNVSQQVSLLVSILQDIVAQKHLPHLMDLLLRLNYNQYYRPL